METTKQPKARRIEAALLRKSKTKQSEESSISFRVSLPTITVIICTKRPEWLETERNLRLWVALVELELARMFIDLLSQECLRGLLLARMEKTELAYSRNVNKLGASNRSQISCQTSKVLVESCPLKGTWSAGEPTDTRRPNICHRRITSYSCWLLSNRCKRKENRGCSQLTWSRRVSRVMNGGHLADGNERGNRIP